MSPLGASIIPMRTTLNGGTITYTPGSTAITFTVPYGIIHLYFDITSAGAPGGGGGSKGGRIQGELPFVSGETYTIYIGGGASGSAYAHGGSGAMGTAAAPGGDASAIVRNSNGKVMAVPGAAAGKGAIGFPINGGNGGGTGLGTNGQSYGGAPVGVSGAMPGSAGGSAAGGTAGSYGGGGGGAGYRGGTGGTAGTNQDSGGGGGEGFADPDCISATGTDAYQTGNGYVTLTWTD